jgi:hypothetical protein
MDLPAESLDHPALPVLIEEAARALRRGGTRYVANQRFRKILKIKPPSIAAIALAMVAEGRGSAFAL